MVLHGHQGAAEIAVFTPLHGAVGPAQTDELLGAAHVGIAVEPIKIIAKHHGIVHVVAKILVLVNLSKARAGEFVQCTATPVAGGNKDFVTDDDGRSGVGAERGAPILKGHGFAVGGVEDDQSIGL